MEQGTSAPTLPAGTMTGSSSPTRISWRQRLFGSLLGQLRVAAFASVFVGFTAASSATLWINQRALIHQHERRVESVSTILRHQLALLARDDSASRRWAAIQELGRYSAFNLVFWIGLSDGSLLVPNNLSDPSPQLLAWQAQQAQHRPEGSLHTLDTPLPAPLSPPHGQDQRSPHRQNAYRVVKVGERKFLTHLHRVGPKGTSLWVAEDISANTDFLTSLLGWLLLAWSVCLGLVLLAIWLMTRRIIQPLQDLNAMAGLVTCASLATSRLDSSRSPLEVRELANGYNKLLDRMALSWENQREFVSAVSHELRNPLTIISGYLKRLQRQGDNLDFEQRRILAKAEAEAHRIARMLVDLLDLSRKESGRLQLVLQAVAVDEVLLNSCDLARTQLERPLQLVLPASAGERPIEALAEADRLQQVVLNLIENADKYSPPDRPIQVLLEQEQGGGLRISVIDQGIGIPPQDLPRIYDRFHRGSNASPQMRGSGLGLSVVKLLVEAMGGTITVVSQLEQGSCFQIHLPALGSPILQPDSNEASARPCPSSS